MINNCLKFELKVIGCLVKLGSYLEHEIEKWKNHVNVTVCELVLAGQC